jgi:cellulose synthase/poly-beta-1,6-N-acetylglucosamine synthase-like glycosyltransferase
VLAGATLLVGAAGGTQAVITGAAVFTELAFAVYFVRHIAFAIASLRSAPLDPRAPRIDTGYRPRVSVLVACKNEGTVVDGLAAALLALDYPAELLQIVVVDDGSTDRTLAILDRLAAEQPRLTIVHRAPGSGGGKSGALNAGLSLADGEIIVVFAADHRPRRDVVQKLVRHFEDPAVGAVQGRCEINNPDDSPLTHLVALDYLAGYLVNEYGRQSLVALPAYGGANCAVRATSLRALGGWNTETVTEDTDVTIRLLLKGERVRYDVSAVDEEEGVVTFARFWRQRYRWARGHQKVWRDYRRLVWSSRRLSLAEKTETTMFLLVFHLPVLSALGLAILGLWLGGVNTPSDSLHVNLLWTLLFLGPLLELGAGMVIGNVDRRNAFALVLFLPVFFVSIAICSKAWVDGIAGRRYSWVKTRRSTESDVMAAGSA